MDFVTLLFAMFAAGSLIAASGVVLLRDPVKGAMSLVACFFNLACLYLLQQAELIAVLEVLVYAGAIMVLFVFVIMLVENHDDRILRDGWMGSVAPALKMGTIAIVAINMVVTIFRVAFPAAAQLQKGFGSPKPVGHLFLTSYLFHFELASVLLLVAIVGAVIISKKDKEGEGAR